MKKNIFKIIIFSFLFFSLASSVRANNDKIACFSGDICAATADDLPEGATGIDPNQQVDLGFGVFQKNTQNSPVCEGNKRVFHAVRHYTVRTGDDYEYIAPGEGNIFAFGFNSGQSGQRSRYLGVFYCWTSSLGTSKFGIDGMFSNKGSKGQDQAWLTPLFDQTTRIAPKLPVETKKPEVKITTTSKKTSLEFSNPLAAETFIELLQSIQTWLFNLALPIAVLVIVISGIMMMASGSKPDWFTKGKKMLLWAVIGLAVILIGEGFLKLIESIINLKNR